ncbi:uncharacterized protein [Gossypium hirsutum]|uniref:Uncharacterized protein n=1 Tax=Gossypium hirsutum TaxID=3635 RepID=A0A1U8IDY8_GOSHI|nr:uncharacterized protein LOC107895543 [Gossypium hirsutum]
MSTRDTHKGVTRGRGRGRESARAGSSTPGHMPAREAPASPVTKLRSHDRAAGDDALSQAMLRVLERVAGASSSGRPMKRAKFDGPVSVVPGIVARPQPYADYGRAHQGKCWKRTGDCFRCGSMDHQGRVQPVRGGQQPPRGRCQARGGNGFGRGHEAPGRGAGNTEARQPALVYAARHREDRDAPDVITGSFLIYNLPYTALIDIRSTHLYVACTVSETLGIQSKNTVSEMTVLSPLGQLVGVSQFFRYVPLEVQKVVFLEDLMELPFGEFDIILGMDWLVKHRAILDCAAKRMVLKSTEDEEAKKLVHKGCEAFLAYVSISNSKGPSVEDVRIAKEFLNVDKP